MKVTINLRKIFLILFFFVNIPPAYLVLNSTISRMFSLFQLLTFFISIFGLFIYILNHRKVSKFLILLLLFWGIFAFSTFINGNGSLSEAIKPFFTSFTLFAMFYLLKDDNEDYIDSMSFYLKLIIFLNFLTVLYFPDGLYRIERNVNAHYFLGHRNNAIEYMIPALLFSKLKDIRNSIKISFTTAFLVIMSFVTVILTWSANAILVMVFLLLTMYLPFNKFFQKTIDIYNFLLMYICLFFSIVIFRLQNYFEWLIVGVLNRSLDFTERIRIWDNAIFWIKKSLWLGYGYERPEYKQFKIYHPNSAHNYILDFVYMGGLLLLFTVILMILVAKLRIDRVRTNSAKVIELSILSYLILGFATPIHKDVLGVMFLVISLGYYCSCFDVKMR